MNRLALGQRVISTWGVPPGYREEGIVVYRKDAGYLATEYVNNRAVKDVIHLATGDNEFIVMHDDGIAHYGYDDDGDYEAIEE